MAEQPIITLVLPYYNEAEYIEATLSSLASQSDRRFRLVLVDNGSTDESAGIARDACRAMPDIEALFLEEREPGKIHALVAGIAEVETPLVGTMDADTIYPSDYVARTLELFSERPNSSCVLAFGFTGRKHERARSQLFAWMFPRKCHTGGYGQNFRLEALRHAGAFDPARWPYVLEDHEIIHRVVRCGPIAYGAGFHCLPSNRRADRSACSWTLLERVMYKLMPGFLMDWFFYRFLARRFRLRGLGNVQLRDKSWANERTSAVVGRHHS